jgi:hypothetical protein
MMKKLAYCLGLGSLALLAGCASQGGGGGLMMQGGATQSQALSSFPGQAAQAPASPAATPGWQGVK